MAAIKRKSDKAELQCVKFFVEFVFELDSVGPAMVKPTIRELKRAADILFKHQCPLIALDAASAANDVAEETKDQKLHSQTTRFLGRTIGKVWETGAISTAKRAQNALEALSAAAVDTPPHSEAGQILAQSWKRLSKQITHKFGEGPIVKALTFDYGDENPHPFMSLVTPMVHDRIISARLKADNLVH